MAKRAAAGLARVRKETILPELVLARHRLKVYRQYPLTVYRLYP